jgi:hypothetical protein
VVARDIVVEEKIMHHFLLNGYDYTSTTTASDHRLMMMVI